MATEKIIVEYIAEVDGLKAELKTVQKEMHNTEKAGVDAGKKTADAFAKTEEKTVSLKAQLKNLKVQLANATDPKEIERLAKAAGALTDQLEDASDAAKVFASESKFEQMGNALGSVKDKLMNLDFKGAADQSKLLVSVVKSFNVTDVVNGVKDIGTAFLNIGKALLMNPLFLIVGAIAGAVYAVSELSDAFEMVGVQTETVTNAIKDQEAAVRGYTDKVINAQIKAKESLGILTKEQGNQARLQMQVDNDIIKQKEKFNQQLVELAEKVGLDLNDTQDGWFSEYYKGNADDLALRIRFNNERTKLEKSNAIVIASIKKAAVVESKGIQIEASAEEIKKQKEASAKKSDDAKKDAEALRLQKIKDNEKALEELANLNSAINDLQKQYRETTLNSDAKELQAIFDKYDKIKLQAIGNKDALIKIEKIYKKELDALFIRQTEADLKADADKLKSKQDLEDKLYLLTLSSNDKEIAEVSNKYEQLIIEAEKAGLDATALRAKQVEETNAVIKKQADDEVKTNTDKNKKIIEDEKKVAEQRKKIQQQIAQTISASVDAIGQISANVTEQKLINIDKETNKEINSLDYQLEHKLISQETYDKKIEALELQKAEKQRKLKKQQFETDRQIAIVKIIIATAQAVITQFAETGYVGAILAGVVGAAELAVVASQPTPQFEKGGEVGGKLHKHGGTLIEAERGEYIINRKDSKDNKSLLEAINTGNGNKYIEDKFIAPMLKEQQKKFNQMKDNAFSDNLVNSMILNSSNFKDSNLLDSMKRSRQADKENMEYLIKQLKPNGYDARRF
jgi:hypothetical protein